MASRSQRSTFSSSNFVPRLAKSRHLLWLALLSTLSLFAFYIFYTSSQSFSVHSPLSWFDTSIITPGTQVTEITHEDQGEAVDWKESTPPSTHRPSVPEKMQSLSDFLRSSKREALQHLSGERQLENGLVIIMGNEAGDLDSIASAISLSYFLSRLALDAVQSKASPTFDFSKPTYVPLLQLNRQDLALRQENLALLETLSIDPSDLLFLDDFDSQNLALDPTTSERFSPQYKTFFGLVDHPSLSVRFGGPLRDSSQSSNPDLERTVVMIIDHHQDEENHSRAALRIIRGPNTQETSGSAISLIINFFKNQLIVNHDLPKELVYLGLGAIVVDTDNLKLSPLGKARPLDLDSHQVLLRLSDFSSRSIDPSESIIAQGTTGASSVNPIRLLKTHLSKFQSSSILNLPSINLENSPPPSDDENPSTNSTKLKPEQAAKTHEFWKLLSGLKSQVKHLNTRELLKRDLKTEIFLLPERFGSDHSPAQDQPEAHRDDDPSLLRLKLSFSSVPLGLTEWLHRSSQTEDLKESQRLDWEKWWDEVETWMREENVNLAFILNSFREKKAGSERGKHRRELIVIYLPPPTSILPSTISSQLFQNLLDSLITDSHTEATDLSSRLMLEYPWKGVKSTESEKKEKVSGIEEGLGGKRIRLEQNQEEQDQEMFGMVFKQTNQKANRKIVVPAVNFALKRAVERVKI